MSSAAFCFTIDEAHAMIANVFKGQEEKQTHTTVGHDNHTWDRFLRTF